MIKRDKPPADREMGAVPGWASRRKRWMLALAAEAAACILLCFAVRLAPGWFTGLLAFPFEQIAWGLRRLSLSGKVGNGIAVILYLAVCLIPAGIFYRRRQSFERHGEDWLLVVLSLLLFYVIYHMINPGLLAMGLPAGGETGAGLPLFGSGPADGGALLGGVIYSVLIGYLVWHTMRNFAGAGAGKLGRYLSGLLVALTVLLVYSAFGPSFGALLESFETLREGNTLMGQGPSFTDLFLVLGYVGNILPLLLDILVIFAGAGLLEEMEENAYSEASARAAERLSFACGISLTAGVGFPIAFNLLQLLCAGSLLEVHYLVRLPLTSAIFALAALLFARYIRAARELKEDHDLFI